MQPRRRIGIYGGSFNPVHHGHLRAAVEVRERLGLTEVWLVPAREPPHKEAGAVAPGAARLHMIERAIAGVRGLAASNIELERPGPSYTIDTLRELQRRHPRASFGLVLGFDTFAEIDTWKDSEALLGACDFFVTTRPPDVVGAGENPSLFGRLPIAVRQAFWYQPSSRCYLHKSGRRLEFVPVTALDISASRIRADVAAGRSIDFLTPPEVAALIRAERLYRQAR